MYARYIFSLITSALLASASFIPAEAVQQRQAEASVEERAAPCNLAACAAAIGATAGLTGACFAEGPATLVCLASVAAGGTASELGACVPCTVISECGPDDQTAVDNACGTPDVGRAELGPNQCVQLSSSVPKPSKTDHVLEGGYTIHCHNTATIVSGSWGTCHYPCKNCSQCSNWPNKRDEDLANLTQYLDG